MDMLTVNYAKLGPKIIKESSARIDLHLDDDWQLDPYVFANDAITGEQIAPIDSQISVIECNKLIKEYASEVFTCQGEVKGIYTYEKEPNWFTIQVTDIEGKKYESIFGWTILSIRPTHDLKDKFQVTLCLPEMMKRIPDEVDHTHTVTVTAEEFANILQTFKCTNKVDLFKIERLSHE